MQQIRWKLFGETFEFQREKKCSMQPLAGKIEQDLFHFHTLMNANYCQSTPLWALIMSKSEHKTEKPEGREQFFLWQNIHVLPKVLYPEHKRESEWGLGQYYNSRKEKCLYCSVVFHWEIYQGGEESSFCFLIVCCIYQSQLTMVCFDFALQIEAGLVGHV